LAPGDVEALGSSVAASESTIAAAALANGGLQVRVAVLTATDLQHLQQRIDGLVDHTPGEREHTCALTP
jgi:hypothetical protein